MMYAEFNINETVWVRLTERGKLEHRRQHDELRKRLPKLGKYRPRATDKDGWSEWQLWELMQTFGSVIDLGATPPFETTIRLSPPGL